MRVRTGGLLALLLSLTSCVGPALLTDGSSVAFGDHRGGLLRGGTALPFRGRGFVVPERWRQRRRNYGTEELVGALMRAAYRVQRRYPGAVVGFADLSPRGGGATEEHGSHTSGRDVDVIFYATDLAGRPLIPREMVAYDATGLALPPPSAPALPSSGGASPEPARSAPASAVAADAARPAQRFDLRRNWALLRELLRDPAIEVQWIFINRGLARLLLDHARRSREPASIVEHASARMHEPGDAGPHDDHLHLRIHCHPSDVALGCRDRGPPRGREPPADRVASRDDGPALLGLPTLPTPPTLLARRFPLL